MPNNRELTAAFGVLSVAWFLFGHTNGFFVGLPSLIIWTDFITYLLMLIFTPAVMLKTHWTALGAVVAGVIRIIRSILGLISLPMSLVHGPAVALILALAFTYFSFRAYSREVVGI